MVKHIVCFKIKDEFKDHINEAKETLLSMKGNVPMLKGIEVGVDFLHSGRSYDIILMVDLEDEVQLDLYQHDDYHCNVVKKLMHSIVETSVAVDYYF